MIKFGFWKSVCPLFMFCVATVIGSPGQITVLHNFFPGYGADPSTAMVQATDGYFYGTTYTNAFKIDSSGNESTFYSFCTSGANCPDGSDPSGLVQASDGNFYGTNAIGESSGCGGFGCGTVFKISSGGTLTTLYIFAGGSDGGNPYGGVVQGATDGNFYGIASIGGTYGQGTVFKITPEGSLTTLYSFCAKTKCADGANPYAGLIQARDGNFYGTTTNGGTSNAGTVFKITSAGTLAVLHSFVGPDGANPSGGLIQDTDGKFYGVTFAGGAYGLGAIFRMTTGGKLTTLYSFCAQGLPLCPDGANPSGGLVQSTLGYIYATTRNGGVVGNGPFGDEGTLFQYLPSTGQLVTEYTFCSAKGGCFDGANPVAALLEGTDGYLYGTTYAGGGSGFGEVFSIPSGDRPFVEAVPASGKVGTAVTILGNNLTGTTKVAFGAKAATFTLVSGSEITTTVPLGATTGKVSVTMPDSKLSSKVPFRVTP